MGNAINAKIVAPTSWTPSILFDGLGVGITYSSRSGIYYQIGNIVFIQGSITLSSKGSSTGDMTIEGIPISIDEFGILGVSYGNITYTGVEITCRQTSNFQLDLVNCRDATNPLALTDANMGNTSTFTFSGCYLTVA